MRATKGGLWRFNSVFRQYEAAHDGSGKGPGASCAATVRPGGARLTVIRRLQWPVSVADAGQIAVVPVSRTCQLSPGLQDVARTDIATGDDDRSSPQ